MRCSVGGRSTVAGTSARAVASVFATASKGFRLREVGIFNTTTTAFVASLTRFTNATNVGAGLTEIQWDGAIDSAPLMTAYAGHTGDGGIGTAILQATIGAAAGAGIIWTFGESGIVVPLAVGNGIGVSCLTGTGQIVDFYYVWDE